MTAKTAPEVEDRIVWHVQANAGLTAESIGRALNMVPQTVRAVLVRLEGEGRVLVREEPWACPTGRRRLWYPA
mgnify:CR=1 FL=1